METRNNTFFGNLFLGYFKDYFATLRTLLKAGIGAHTLFSFPKKTEEYPLTVLSSAARMTEEEKAAAEEYMANGGIILASGPSALPTCKSAWVLPHKPDIDHALDEMRFHRSRVNLINKVTPIGISEKITLRCALHAEVFTPFDAAPAKITQENDRIEITLPPQTAYAIITLKK